MGILSMDVPIFLRRRKAQIYKELSEYPVTVVPAANAMGKYNKDSVLGSAEDGSEQGLA